MVELYSGPRCPSCGGDHFPEERPSASMRSRSRVVAYLFALVALLLSIITAGASWGPTA